MPDKPAQVDAYSVGAAGAILSIVGIIASGPLALPVIAFVQAQPPWDGPALYVEHFHRIQTLPFYFGFLLVTGSILMLVSIYRLSTRKAAALAALIFMSTGAAFAILNYVIQTTYIPTVVNAYAPELGSALTALSMANPTSLTWAMEMWGYGFMGLGTWLAAGFFGPSRLERITGILFVVNGVVSMLGALLISIDLGRVFSLAGLVGYGVWNILYLALAVAFFRVLAQRRSVDLGGSQV